ncbi:MAG: Coenzyme F420 hydrogenase/dehydrogenase, beta subunit C-terminal domain [Spirosomataceae bacterium]
MNRAKSIQKVVESESCVGCGACAFVTRQSMDINEYGEYVPNEEVFEKASVEEEKLMDFVCPSLNEEYNEDKLASHFLEQKGMFSNKLGMYQSIYGGYVKEGNFRRNGTSGGFGTWIGNELLKRGMIDGVIHVKESRREKFNDPFFKYSISSSEEELQVGAQTRYHVVEISEVLTLIKSRPGRYLFIGLPCMVKAVRRIQLIDPIIKESIKYTSSLICGHLKSINWTLSLAWGAGVKPMELSSFQYRIKGNNISARAYIFKAFFGKEKLSKVQDSGGIIGGKFNQGALMLPACNFCDDLVGETADITIGDAWLSRYEIDQNGTNLLIVRNSEINSILNVAFNQNRINIDKLQEKDAIYAQSGGFRQRREGLAYRLKERDRLKIWRPVKRVSSDQYNPPLLRRIIYKLRSEVTRVSREAFFQSMKQSDYSIYKQRMQLILKVLRVLEVASSIPRILNKKSSSILIRLSRLVK